MDKFVHEENLKHYRHLLMGVMREEQRSQILKLFAEETANPLKISEFKAKRSDGADKQ